MNLEIASGERPLEGFVHNDLRPLPHIEYVCDAREALLAQVGENVVEQLVARHCLEHFPWPETVAVLGCWKKMLKPGGRIHIEVPNMGWQVRACASGEITAEEFVYFAYGEQNYEGNFHFVGFTQESLSDKLRDTGYVDVEVRDIGQVLIATAAKQT